MTEMMKMHADLVSPPSMQNAFNQTNLAACSKDAIFGLGRAPARVSDRHSLSIDGVSSNFLFNHARGLAQFSGNEREINFLHRPLRELFGQFAMRLIIFGNDNATARFLIETMNNAWPFFAADAGKGGAMMEQRVDQGVLTGWRRDALPSPVLLITTRSSSSKRTSSEMSSG